MKRKANIKSFALLIILVIGLIFRLRQWNDYMIFPDSYHYLSTSQDIFLCGKPLYCTIVNLFENLFFDAAFTIRILSLICSLVSIILIYYFFENKKSGLGLISALLLALSFIVISWTNFILPDLLAITLFLVFLTIRSRYIATIFLFFAALTRPEYLMLLPLAYLLYPKDKKIQILLFSYLMVGVIYYVNTYNFPMQILTIKSSPFLIVLNIIKYEPLLIFSAIAGLVTLRHKINKYETFFIFQIIIFLAIFAWVNPSNWRYGIHIIIPLIYFGSHFISDTILNIKRGKRAYDYLATGIIILFILQIYISYTGIIKNVPRSNYESDLLRKSQDIARFENINVGRYATIFKEAVNYELGEEGVSPLTDKLQKGDLLIYDTVLSRKGYKVKNIQTRELANFTLNQIFYIGQEKLYQSSIVLYLVE